MFENFLSFINNPYDFRIQYNICIQYNNSDINNNSLLVVDEDNVIVGGCIDKSFYNSKVIEDPELGCLCIPKINHCSSFYQNFDRCIIGILTYDGTFDFIVSCKNKDCYIERNEFLFIKPNKELATMVFQYVNERFKYNLKYTIYKALNKTEYYKEYSKLIELKYCKICGEAVVFLEYNYNEYFYCYKCFRDNFSYCSRCDTIKPKKELEDHTGYCLECQKRNFILPYHRHYPKIKFYNKGSEEKLYFGVELEVDEGGESDSTVKKINNIMNNNDNFIYCSHDGSLENGFEIITQPATLEYHMSIKNKYKEMFQELIKNGYLSDKTTTCGIHVHFNRDYFAENEEMYITKLLYLIDKNWDNVVIFSRRNTRRMDRYAKKLDMTEKEFIEKSNKKNIHQYHYYAVNLSNDNTIEFRMFKGSLNINTFIAILQFVHSCIICAKTMSAEEIQRMDFSELMTKRTLKSYWNNRVKMYGLQE